MATTNLTEYEKGLFSKFVAGAHLSDEPATREQAQSLIEQHIVSQVKAERISYPAARKAFASQFRYLPDWALSFAESIDHSEVIFTTEYNDRWNIKD